MKQKKAHHELIHLLSANAIITIIGFLNVIYIARYLEPAQFANFGVAVSVFYFFTSASAPVRMLLARFIPLYSTNNQHECIGTLLTKIWKWIIVISFLIIILTLIASGPLINWLKLPSIWFLLAIPSFAGLNVFANAGRGLFNGLRQYSKYNISTYIETCVRFASCFFLFFLWRNATSAVSAYLIGALLASMVLCYWARPIIKKRGGTIDWYEIKKFAFPLMAYTGSFMLFYCLDTILSKAYLPGNAAGNYAATLQLARVFGLVGSSFGIMLLPALSECVAKGQPTKKFMYKTIGSYIGLSLTGLIIIAFFSTFIIKIVLGNQYVESTGLLLPIASAITFMTISSLIGIYFLVVGIYKVFILPVVFVIIEAVAIWMFHTTSFQIAINVLIVQALLCVCMLICVFITKEKHHFVKMSG